MPIQHFPTAMDGSGLTYGENLLATATLGSTYRAWTTAVNAILVAGCSNICNEVANTKIATAHGAAPADPSDVSAPINYIESPYSKRSFIDFKDNNTISVKYDDETIVRNASYTCEEFADSPYGKYLIQLPKEVRSKVAEKMGVSESHVVVDGYILLDNDEDLSEPCWTLFITDKEGHDVGVEGGSDFHYCSGFIPN